MSKERIQSDLYSACNLNRLDKVKEILRSFKGNIDITYKEGVYFDFAIARGNIEILKELLSYVQVSKIEPLEIYEILNKAIDNYGVDKVTQDLVNQYMIGQKEYESSYNDKTESDNKENLLFSYDFDSKLTADNLQKLNTQYHYTDETDKFNFINNQQEAIVERAILGDDYHNTDL